MPLSQRQVEDVCLLYKGADQCRYLEEDDTNYGKYICRKMTPDRAQIDDRVDKYIEECKKDGVDPNQNYYAIGDNCTGYRPFKDILQGYDV